MMSQCSFREVEHPRQKSGQQRRKSGWIVRVLAAAFLFFGQSACDFDVTNPGPVQDESVDNPSAFPAVVNGIVRAMNEALNYIALHGAVAARELFPTGQTGQFGVEPSNAIGFLEEDEQDTPWANAQQARWLAEAGIQRFREVLDPEEFATNPIVAEAFLWSGFANRLLGENMCQAVFDGGAPQPATEYLTRAEEDFTRAIEIADAAGEPVTAMAATAGRASVRVDLGNWAGAVVDASQVPTDFVFQIDYYDMGNEFQYNRIAWASMNQPHKSHTVWGTVYEEYYRETGDPRTPYLVTDDVGTGALDCCGPVPWFPQQKYERASAINIVTGREMRLVEAEALLRDGDWPAAMAIIDGLRAAVGVEPWEVASLEGAWTALKRERGIELWLEGRRLGDLRRWEETGTPGALDPRELPGEASHLEAQDLCFPIGRAERETNPNIP